MDDSRIVELFFDRDESVFSLVEEKYSRLYLGMLRQTLVDESDVEECASDLLLSLWNSIPPARPKCLPAFICKLARRIGINRYRYNTRKKRGSGYTVMLSELEEYFGEPTEPAAADETDDARIGEVLSVFLRALDAESRVLFVRRYFYLESVTSLSKRFDMSENAVSVKLHRAKNKLKKLLEKEEIDI